MSVKHYIGLDVHCQSTEMAVVTGTGRVTKRLRCPTTLPSLIESIESIAGQRHVVLEEGPISDWVYRGLQGYAAEVAVCDPRQNHLICKGSDKTDRIDAEKLAQLHRGGYTKAVHHPESLEQAVFKHQVNLYHDHVHQRVRQANRVMGFLRHYGVFVQENKFSDGKLRSQLLKLVPGGPVVRSSLRSLLAAYQMACDQESDFRRRLVRLARRQQAIRRFIKVPGVYWIRAATFFGYIDTPWRFRNKSALWRYMGIGLEQHQSGAGAGWVRVSMCCNYPLKDMILGAAKSAAASRDNPFADQHRRWLSDGLGPRIARRNVARSLAATLWGMFKSGQEYRPELVDQSIQQLAAGYRSRHGC
jgi:transposase